MKPIRWKRRAVREHRSRWPRTAVAAAVLLALAVSGAAIEAAGLYGKSYAVVVGINDYASSEWSDLPFARNDAKAIEAYLRSGGFDEVVTLLDSAATRTGILAALEDRIAPKLGAEDRVVFFFSGHGATRRFGDRDYGYLVPYDASTSSSTWLSMTTLREISQKLGTAKHQLFILDSCFGGSLALKSGFRTVSQDHPNYIREVSRRSARQFLTAGGDDQQVRAVGPDGYSYFTGYLLEALEEGLGDLDGDGYITVIELAQYLQSRATNDDQTPGFGDLPGHGLGAFLFAGAHRSSPAVRSGDEVAISLKLKGAAATADGVESSDRVAPVGASVPKPVGQPVPGTPWTIQGEVVIDRSTKLMWTRGDLKTIRGTFAESWDDAMAWASEMNARSYAGYDDWRVASIAEYRTIRKPSYGEVFQSGNEYSNWARNEISEFVASYISFKEGFAVSGNKVGQRNLQTGDLFDFSARLVRSVE